MHVGVVGLGAMGRAVAANFVGAGLRTTVWNRSPQPVADLAARGAIAAGHVGEAFGCDMVLSLLLGDAAVRAVILDSGVLDAAPAGTVHVCMSSASTGLARDLAQAHGAGFAAAPMFGRVEAAAAARLEIATAGPPALLDRVEPVLRVFGHTWRMGVERTLGEAQASGIRMPPAELMLERLQHAENQSFPDEDWSVTLAKIARALARR